MKTIAPAGDTARKTKGAALVIVLAFLALGVVLVLGFFSSVSTELVGAKQYASGAKSKQLADSAVQAVMGTIKLATSGTAPNGAPAAWASQPGMIRTYNDSGAPLTFYKLYSSDNTVVTTGTFNPAADYDGNWSTKPALFTDLNSPLVSSGATVFPIVDGNAMKLLTKTSIGTTTAPYLGYDANGDGLPDIEGFSIDPAKVSYAVGSALSPTNTPVPMPVKWIYILQDGTLTAPDATSGAQATFDSAPAGKQPTAANPIAGRMAYWTDDESCKVNINTASQGAYSDMPRSASTEDKTLAVNQPLNKEFQRYPGHPATTSLSPVFSGLWLGQDATSINEKIYSIIPRVSGGGSKGGTVKTTGSGTSYGSITLDNDRLYASVDELMFTPTLSGATRATQGLTQTQLEQSRFFITASSRAPDVNLFNKPRVCIWPVSDVSDAAHRTTFDQLFAFCSTSNNHAYYFERNNSDSATNDLPNTVADTHSPTGLERNRMLLDYLHYLTSQSIPGFGGNFQGKYSATNISNKGTDCDQILTEIFDYIRCTNLWDKGLGNPPAGAPFAPGNTLVRQGQVVPIQDKTRDTRGFGRFPTIDKAFFMFIGSAQNPPPSTTSTPALHIPAVPALADMNPYKLDTNSTGVLDGKLRMQVGFFMEFFTPAQGHIYLYPKFKVQVDGLEQCSWGPLALGTTSATLPKSVGSTTGDIVTVRTSGMPSSQSFISTTPGGSNMAYLNSNAWRGGNMGFAAAVFGQGTTGATAYPFVASTTTTTTTIAGVPTATTSDLDPNGKFYFKGGDITMKLYNAAGDTVVQTLTVNFPDAPAQGFPVPKLAPTTPLENQAKGSSDSLGNFRYFVTGTTTLSTIPPVQGTGGRLNSSGLGVGATAGPCSWIIDNDVVRSVEVASGDPRLVAAQTNVPSSMFASHPSYLSPTLAHAHSLRSAGNNPYYGATVGRLVQLPFYSTPATGPYTLYGALVTPTYSYNYRCDNSLWDYGNPGITSDPGVLVGGAGGSTSVLGDWDNPYGGSPDGPYINKPDEGDGDQTTPGAVPYFESKIGQYLDPQPTLFSPNRQVPSAVTFGSLPTGVFANKPWQTLLFRSLPIGHPGLGKTVSQTGDQGPPYSTPPDHLLLDLFNMPVVEPYPISEPLSTAGRINMNYQIAPFTYINRDTGIRAVLNSERVIAIPDSQSTSYKGGNTAPDQIRYPVNVEETLKGFTARFGNNDLFRSASEICSIHLVPLDPTDPNATYANMPAYWWKTSAYVPPAQAHRLTGDNSRERPYATIYPRLTTKSNTFTVHFRVQTLKKVKGTPVGTWDEKKDIILSEYRGSQAIERYVDASDPNIPDYADPAVYNSTDSTKNPPIDKFYKFRVLNSKRFFP